jgi:hypothetical protein
VGKADIPLAGSRRRVTFTSKGEFTQKGITRLDRPRENFFFSTALDKLVSKRLDNYSPGNPEDTTNRYIELEGNSKLSIIIYNTTSSHTPIADNSTPGCTAVLGADVNTRNMITRNVTDTEI